MKNKAIVLPDLILIPLFALTLYSGFELHVAGHTANHVVWHNWAALHTIAGLLFSLTGGVHVKAHWGWYKGMYKKGLGGKSKITSGLSCAFVLVLITGMVLLFCTDGANSPVGSLHYIIGIIMGVCGILHILKRFSLLKTVIGVSGVRRK